MTSPKSPPRLNSQDAFDTNGTTLGFGEKWNNAGKAKRPSIAGIQVSPTDGRRKSSVAFNTAPAEETIRRESSTRLPTLSNILENRRMSSPPPPQTYQRGVSFDTFDNKDATDLSFTLTYKHKDYHNTRRSRTFLCGTDQKDYSEFALEWLIDELVDDGDEIVCLRVVEKDSSIASTSSVEAGRYRDEAQKLLDSVIKKNSQEEKAISLIMELAVGRVQDIIQRMVSSAILDLHDSLLTAFQIQIYEPAVLIVGTRGRNLGGMQGLMPGSVSKYCLQQSPIPVIVVRPSAKRAHKKKKRLADPTRASYGNILAQAHSRGGSTVLDKKPIRNSIAPLPEATDQEAAAVAKAIGLPKDYKKGHYRGGSLNRVISARSDSSDPSVGSPGPPPEGFLPAGYLRSAAPVRADKAMKDPMIAALGDENWDDFDEKLAEREKKGAGNETTNEGESRHVDSAVDETGESLVVPHPVDARRSSHGPKPDWLKDILSEPERPRSRSRSHQRNWSG